MIDRLHVGTRAAHIVETRRNGRETVCRLRPDAFEELAARERTVLGLGHGDTTKAAAS